MASGSLVSILKWLFLATLAAVVPWLPLLLDFKLIGDYFQPALSIAASLLGVLALPVGHVAYRNSSPTSRRLQLFCLWLPALALCLGACLYFTLNVTSIFAGTRLVAFRALWIFLYLGLFFSFGMILSLVGRQQ